MKCASCLSWWAGLVGLVCSTSAAPPYEALYAFGDSLTDTGRDPAPDIGYYERRYSNGPLWVEYLSTRLGFPYDAAKNFAESGARTDQLLEQVMAFTPATNIDQSLFVPWAGGNDFIQRYDEFGIDDNAWDQFTTSMAANLSNAVVRLVAVGARSILVPNTVDVSDIPTFNKFPGEFRSYLRSKVTQFNTKLAAAMDQIRAAHPAITLVLFDFYARTKDLLANYRAYGFTEKDVGALDDFTLFDKSFDGPGRNYVFWDIIHPTTKAHGIIADWYHAAVAPMRPALAPGAAGNSFSLSLSNLHVGKIYAIQQTADWTGWSEAQNFTNYTGPSRSVALTNVVPPAFFRARFQP